MIPVEIFNWNWDKMWYSRELTGFEFKFGGKCSTHQVSDADPANIYLVHTICQVIVYAFPLQQMINYMNFYDPHFPLS